MSAKKLKTFLAGTFLVAASAGSIMGGSMVWLAHDNAAASGLVMKLGDTVTFSDTGILWGDRHGCPVTGSGTSYTARDTRGNEVGGIVCKPIFGNPQFK